MLPFTKSITKHIRIVRPVTGQQFVDHYHGPKKAAYQRALNSIINCRKPLSHYAEVGMFIKYEKSFKRSATPRIISPRKPEYRVIHGRYAWPLEKQLFKTINSAVQSSSELPSILKGMNQMDRGKLIFSKWDRFKNPVAIFFDANRFDKHVSEAALRYEHSQELRFFIPSDRKKLKKILEHQIVNKCTYASNDGSIQFKVRGKRMSGDFNTGSGNILIMVAMVYSYLMTRKVRYYEIIDDGDDCGVIIEMSEYQNFLPDLQPWFKTLGFPVTVEEPVYEIEQISFCQSQPIYDGANYLMVRDPRTAIRKDLTCLVPIRNVKEYKNWLTSVGVGGMSLAARIPVWQAFYLAMIRGGTGGKVQNQFIDQGLDMKLQGMNRKEGSILDITRLSFYKAFGITPTHQRQLEDYFNNASFDYGRDQEEVNLELARYQL